MSLEPVAFLGHLHRIEQGRLAGDGDLGHLLAGGGQGDGADHALGGLHRREEAGYQSDLLSQQSQRGLMLRSLALPLLGSLRKDGPVLLGSGDQSLPFGFGALTVGLLALLLLGIPGLQGVVPFSFGFAGLALGDTTLLGGFVRLIYCILPCSVGLLARDQCKHEQQRQDADCSGETSQDQLASAITPLAIALLDLVVAYIIDVSQDGMPSVSIGGPIDFAFLAVELQKVCSQWHLHQFAEGRWKGHTLGLLGAGFVVGNARVENGDNIFAIV